MKNWLLLVSCFFLSSWAISQTRLENRLHQLWQTDQDKCIKKAEKFIQKEKAQSIAHYYIVLQDFNRAQQKNSAVHWKKVLRSYRIAKNYPSEELEILSLELDLALNDWAQQATETDLLQISTAYTQVYQDTLQAFLNWQKLKEQEIVDEANNTIAKGVDSLRRALLSVALDLEGTPYKWAGVDTNGFDCSGFTQYVYKSVGIDLPHNAHLQATWNQGIEKTFEDAQPGDLLFFGSRNGDSFNVSHAGILFEKEPDSTKVIHCVSSGVSIDGDNSSWEYYWKDKVLFARSLLNFSE